MAAENDKAQRKEVEDEGVFFRFGDDLVVDTTRIEPVLFAANLAPKFRLKVSGKKSPIGLLIKPEPTQAEESPVE